MLHDLPDICCNHIHNTAPVVHHEVVRDSASVLLAVLDGGDQLLAVEAKAHNLQKQSNGQTVT